MADCKLVLAALITAAACGVDPGEPFPNLGGGASAGGSGGGAGGMPAAGGAPMGGGPTLADEFDGPAADLLAMPEPWQVHLPERAHSIARADGRLRIVAENPPPGQNWAWFSDAAGTLFFREITGNFAVTARLRVTDDADPSQRPSGDFNAGGFVIRDPAGTHRRDENWIMYNVGAQGRTGYSREIKKTVDSASGLYLNPAPFEETALLVCRVGPELRFWYWSGANWEPERFQPDVTQNVANAWPEVDRSGAEPMRFVHETLPERVQVGVMAHAWVTAGPDDATRTRADYDYVRFAAVPPASFEDCPAAFPAP